MSATILTDEQILDCFDRQCSEILINFDADELYPVGRAVEQAVLESPKCASWVDVRHGEPNCNGRYVVRINKHGHLRLGLRVLNSDTLHYQWQVDGEICASVTHYLPIPSLSISEQP